MRSSDTGGQEERTTAVDNKTVESLRKEWETEQVTATGSAPVVSKYSDPARDKELARRGAVLDAEKNMAAKISAVRVSETVVMSDLMTTTFAQSQLSAVLKDITVVSETFNEKENRWDVTIQMPKVNLLKIVSQTR